jgi:hypothetical protein
LFKVPRRSQIGPTADQPSFRVVSIRTTQFLITIGSR